MRLDKGLKRHLTCEAGRVKGVQSGAGFLMQYKQVGFSVYLGVGEETPERHLVRNVHCLHISAEATSPTICYRVTIEALLTGATPT